MNIIKTLLVLLLIAVIIDLAYRVDKPTSNASIKPFRYSYEQGQIIYPEYSGEDTLIVNDATGLNAAMQNVHDHLELYPFGDSQYDSLFRQYCKVFISCRYEGRECPNYNTCAGHLEKYLETIDYKLALYNDTMWLYTPDNKLVGKITTKYNSPLDSLILKDNQ